MLSLRSALLLAVAFVCLLTLSSAQTNLITNGGFETGDFTGWSTPLGVNDTAVSTTARLRAFSYGTCSSSPCGWAYTGSYSALWESSSFNQSITQAVAVTGGTAYYINFAVMFTDGDTTSYLQVNANFNDGTNMLLLTPNGGGGAMQSYCSGSAASQPPFYWSLFTFSVTAPSAASMMNLTFYGYDSEYGFLVDTIQMYTQSGNSQPSAPASLTPSPSNNLLVNGNFESGSVAPWREANGDNPFGLTGNTYAGEGAYNFNGYSGHSGIPCPQGNYCFTFGAPTYSLPIQQTISVPSTSSQYTLSFLWYSPGGYNSSNPSDVGSAFTVGYAWGSNSPVTLLNVYNTTQVTSATNYNTQSYNIGAPPSGATTLTLQMQGYFYATYYVVDSVTLTANSVTASQSAPVYTCGQTTTALTLNTAVTKNSAAQTFSNGLTAAAILSAALAMLML